MKTAKKSTPPAGDSASSQGLSSTAKASPDARKKTSTQGVPQKAPRGTMPSRDDEKSAVDMPGAQRPPADS